MYLHFARGVGSAARFGYFNDEYLRNFVTKPPRRSPLINRGYYIRCKVIRDIIR
jgi:tRNA wybutosine-synthesizing protein 4